jgi:hypothetical protein
MAKGKSAATATRTSVPLAAVPGAKKPRGGGATKASAANREALIAEAAYYRAEQRGFQGGDPVQDWLAAEAEVDRALSAELH